MTERTPSEVMIHQLNNHLAVIVGFAELLVEDFPLNDPRRGDLVEVLNAARAAMAMMPALTNARATEGTQTAGDRPPHDTRRDQEPPDR